MNITKTIVAASALAIASSVGVSSVAAEAATPRIAISGYTWNDVDKDAKIDKGEKRIARKSVVLLDYRGRVIRKTTTNSVGRYSFTKLPKGTYTVRTGIDSWTGTSLAGVRKSLNASKTSTRAYKAKFARNTSVSFGFYRTIVATKPKPVVTKPVDPPVTNSNVGDQTGWSVREKDALVLIDKVRAANKLPLFTTDATLHKNARATANTMASEPWWTCSEDPACTYVVTSQIREWDLWWEIFGSAKMSQLLDVPGAKKVGIGMSEATGKKVFVIFAK